MKKIIALFLMLVMLSSLYVPTFASGDSFIFKATENVFAATGETSADGMIMFCGNNKIGFKINSKDPVTSMMINYRTGAGSHGKSIIRLDAPDGPAIGLWDSSNDAGDTWDYYSSTVTFSQTLKGEHTVYICAEPSTTSAHWLIDFTFYTGEELACDPWFEGLGDLRSFADIPSYAEALKIVTLMTLGIVEDENQTYFYPETPLSRREFAACIARAVGAEAYATEELHFVDINKDEKEAKLIDGLYQMGIIRGDGRGYFYPERFINLNEAANICASVLGYGPLVRQKGNAVEVMSQIKLLKGLKLDTSYLTRGDGINMLYNMCMADSLTESEYSEDGIIYKKERSILEKNLGIHYGEGIVTSNYATSLYAVKPKFDTVGINNESFKLGLTAPGGYLGVNCEYFYKIEDGDKVLLSIYPSAKTESVVLKSSQNSTFKKLSTTQVIYRDALKDEDEVYDLAATAAIIYNGISIDRPLSDVLAASTFKGTITLIDNDKDDVYDTMKIDHGRTIVVDQLNNDYVYDKLTDTTIAARNQTVFVYKGNSLTMADEVGKNSVLTLYESANLTGKRLLRFRMSENTVLGKITSISNGKITVDNQEYGISSLCQDLLEVGTAGVFKLDDFNEVVCYEADSSADVSIGFFMDAFQEVEGLSQKTLIKLLVEGKKQPIILEKASKICADGVTVSEDDDFYSGKGVWAGVENLTKKKPVLYRVNGEGQLTMLDTENPGTGGVDDKLTRLSEPKTYRRLGNFLITVESIGYMNRFPARGNTKHIVMPAGKDESYYSITTGFSTPEDRDIITTTPYSIKHDSIFADIIVSENYAFGSSVGSSSYKVPFMFDSAVVKVNENGDVVNCIKGREANGEVTYEIDEDFYAIDADFRNVIDSLQKGDLIWAVVGAGVLEDARLIYTPGGALANDAGQQTLINSGANRWSYDNLNSLSYGTLKDPEEGYMKLTLDGGTDWYPYNVNGVKVIVCEEADNGKVMISQGRGISSIYSTDKVLMYMADRGVRGLYVYRGTFR